MTLASTPKRAIGDTALAIATSSAVVLILVSLVVIIGEVLVRGGPRLTFSFLLEAPKNGMMGGGIFPAIVGTAAMVILMTVACVPVGVATAVYLSEYASPDSRAAAWIRIAVRNLAGDA